MRCQVREELQVRVVHSWLVQSPRNQGLPDYSREDSSLGETDPYCMPTDPWEPWGKQGRDGERPVRRKLLMPRRRKTGA